jgi:transketolase
MREAFIKTLINAAKLDKNIVLITGDLGFGVLDDFQKELPNQFINSGINEQTMMGMAAGIASTGKRVFVYSIGNFPTLRCLEQIRNDVCSMNNPVVVVSVGAGYAYGAQGYTHHALEDIAIMRSLPNIEVIGPADSFETEYATQYLAKNTRPAFLRLGKSNEPKIFDKYSDLIPGKIHEIVSGIHGSILFTGSIGVLAVSAAKVLAKKGIFVSVASMPFISDPDIQYLRSAALKGPIISIEEHTYKGGFGGAILECLNSNSISANFGIIAADHINFTKIGSQEFLRESNGLNIISVVDKFMDLLANQA